ncbi:MAG: T9SS type A sorting domain-containing protein [Flavobacteriaceae bacterium]|nr:T9SS type A sorting domain-containing protein [Flavobacteriaceae bacterium]
MKKLYLAFLMFSMYAVNAQTVIHSYSFEDNGSANYTTSAVEYSDGLYDFFTSTFNNAIAGNYGVTGQDGDHYFAAQDMDGDGEASEQTLSMTFDVSGYSGLALKILVAEDDYQDPKWDDSDFFHIDYSIDGGASTPLLWIESEASGTNSETRIDADFDGVGEGDTIPEAFMEVTEAITGTGNSLTLTFTFKLDSGGEDIAIDNVRILEGFVANTTPTLSITSPDDNATIYDSSVDINLFVENFSVGNTQSDDGHVHYTLDSGDPVMKYDTTPISLTDLSEGTHTVVVSLVDAAHNQLSPPVSATVNFEFIDPIVSLPYSETFDYTIDSSLSGQGKWQSLYSGDDIMVVDGNLTYNNVESTGKKVSFSGSGKEAFVDIDNQDELTVASFWLNVTDISSVNDSDGGYFAIFGSEGSPPNFESRIWLKPSTDPIGTTYNLSFSSASSNPDYVPTEMNVNETYLVVMSYNNITGEIKGWINPVNSSSSPSMTMTDTSPARIEYFILRQDSPSETAALEIDELKIGTSVSNVLSTFKFDNKKVSVYPNPVHSNLNFIGLSEPVQASVYDMTGRLHMQKEVTNTLDVSSLKAGIYMVKIQNESGSKVFNILKN